MRTKNLFFKQHELRFTKTIKKVLLHVWGNILKIIYKVQLDTGLKFENPRQVKKAHLNHLR